MSSDPSDKSEGNNSPIGNPPDTILQVKCGNKHAAFYVAKCKRTGKTVGKCIKYQGRWMSPSEFESLAGVAAKKWKQSIKYGDKPLGVWLAQNAPFEPLLEASQHDNQLSGSDLDNTVTVQHLISDCPTTVNTEPETDFMAAYTQSTCSHNEVNKLTQASKAQAATQQSANHSSDKRKGELQSDNLVSEGTSMSQDYSIKFDKIFTELEKKLTTSIKQVMDAAFDAVKRQLANEIQHIMSKVDHLSARVAQLEEKVLVTGTTNCTDSLPSTVCHPNVERSFYADVVSNTENIKIQVGQLQKALEMNEREKKERNIVIVGLSEDEGSCETQVEGLIKEKLKLNLKDTKISQAKRLGRFNSQKSSRVLY